MLAIRTRRAGCNGHIETTRVEFGRIESTLADGRPLDAVSVANVLLRVGDMIVELGTQIDDVPPVPDYVLDIYRILESRGGGLS